jgi:cytochrome P450
MTELGLRLDLGENPLPAYDRYREAGAIVANDGVVPTGVEWIATDRATIAEVFRDPGTFSSAGTTTHLGNTRPMIPLEIDPPEHLRYRKLLDPFFSPNLLRKIEPELRRQVNDFIDSFIDRGSVDLLGEFFIPYPTQVFLTMYGLPLADRDRFLFWKDEAIRTGLTDPEAAQRAVAEVYAYVADVVETREELGDDLLSQLIAQARRGEGLTLEELQDITFLFMLAGLDTVTTALTLSFAYLARHPDQRRQLVADSSLVPAAVEELLRITTPAPAKDRHITRDIELGGVTMRAGESVSCHLGAANGDPEVCTDPHEVNWGREANKHATFGLGVHRCLGSHLARMELRVVLEEFHRRIPDYEIAADADLFRVPFYEGLERLQIEFPAGGR